MKRRKHRRKIGKERIGIVRGLSLILLIAIFLTMFFLYLRQQNNRRADDVPEIDFGDVGVAVVQPEEPSDASVSVPAQETVPEIFPEPDYDFHIEEVTLALDGVTREHNIAWVSDLHLISDHEAGDLLGDVHAEYLDAINKRYEGLAVTDDGIHAEELWPEIIKYLNYNAFDGVIFGGDMMDYCSNSNIAIIKEGLDGLRIPYIYIRADHDYGAYYGGVCFTEEETRALHQTIDGDEMANKFWDRNEFMVLGIDNSTKDIPDYYVNMVADVYTRERPVIMATHVPYESKIDNSLAEFSMQVRNTIYYWSDVSERFHPNDNTRRYLDMIYQEDTVVAQVLAGHLHASWDGMLTQQVPQHIFGPAFGGNIGWIHIVPAE